MSSSAKADQKAAPVSWLEAVLHEACEPAGASLTLHLPSGIRAELASTREVALAAALIRQMFPTK